MAFLDSVDSIAILRGAHHAADQRRADYGEAFAMYAQAIANLQRRRDELLAGLQREECVEAGLNAYIDKVRKNPRGCGALFDTGQRFKNGNPVSHAQLAFERAYDNKAAEFGMPELIEARRKARV